MNNDVRLLDSSVIISHFRRGGAISQRLETLAALYVPGVALGELYSGALRSTRPGKNFAQIEQVMAGASVLAIDDETARHYGRISARLGAQGTPIPHNDMWIAACAVQWGLMLATTDDHFERIQGLNFEKW